MATPASKSKTNRAPIGGEDSKSQFLRRSRSLSRISRPMTPESEPDYIKNAPRGKFVNTERGTTADFPEISLDDLAIEFFSSSSSRNENENEGGKEREGRSVSRRRGGEIGRWASDTESSRRRGRSVSRSRSDAASASVAKSANSSTALGPARRRRSLSVARYNQGEVDQSRGSSNRANVRAPTSGNGKMPLISKAPTSSNRLLRRSLSHKDLSVLNDGYSSQSSALTDEEPKVTRLPKNGFEKIVRVVHTQNKAEHPTADVADGGLYEAVRKELRYAVEEIRTELNQAIGRNQAASTGGELLQSDESHAVHGTRNNYASKLGQLEKSKHEILSEMPHEEQRGREVSKKVKKLPLSKTVAERPSRARKRSNDRNRTRRLSEEAEKIFEDFLSNIEDTDMSSFDGERSDASSTFGGTMKAKDALVRETEIYKSPSETTSRPVEMDGVALPWLQWETLHDGSPSGKNVTESPVTPKTLQWDTEKDVVLLHDPSSYSGSSHGSWNPAQFSSPVDNREEPAGKNMQVGKDRSGVDMEEYRKLGKDEELLFEMYRERNRINTGGLLLCSGFLY